MATNRVTVPKSHKGLKAVYITPSEEGLLRKTNHPKGSPQPKKGPGGLLMMDGEDDRDAYNARMAAKKAKKAPKKTPKKTPKKAAKAAPKNSYADYVKKYPDLEKHYDEKVKKTGASMEAWGKAHWDKHGSKAENRSLSGSAAAAAGDRQVAIPVYDDNAPLTGAGRNLYREEHGVDSTSTNPAYWNSAISYFKSHPNGNPKTGELGIWIPNFEKQGAESVALAFIAGGGKAHVNSNYANRTVTDEGRAKRVGGSLTAKGSESYRGEAAEKPIRLNSISRGGTDVETGRPMGGTDPIGYGAHILGGKVVKEAMSGYLKDGGDYGGLLGLDTRITGDWLTERLGGMDSDGMRLRGTFPSVAGAIGSGVGAGGTKTSVGGLYAGGVDPLAKMPDFADYTAYMDPNSVFGGLSDNESVKSGLLYQPMASNYGARMEAAGMPAFSPGLLGSFTGAGSPTYSSAPSGFKKAAAGGAAGASGGVIGAAGTKYLWPKYFSGDAKSKMPILSKHAPKFATESVLYDKFGSGDYSAFLRAHPEAGGFAKVMDTGRVYRSGTGTEYDTGTGWLSGKAYAAKT